jgi:Patatin-like phospholipase
VRYTFSRIDGLIYQKGRHMTQLSLLPISKKILVVLSIALLTASCGVKIDASRQHISGSLLIGEKNSAIARSIAKANQKAMERYKNIEWKYNRNDKNSAPKMCLALSGGGIRSASFSIGVLKGLNEKGILDQIDVMSAVSGGSYALSWYYIQQYKYGSRFKATEEMLRQFATDKTKQQMVDSLKSKTLGEYETLDQLIEQIQILLGKNLNEDELKIVNDFSRKSQGDDQLFTDPYLSGLADKSRMYGFGDMAGTAIGNIVMIPFNFLINGVFTGNVNTTSQRAYYEHAIKRTFHSSVDEPFVSDDMLYMESISFDQINNFIITNELPYFIINTSADIDDDRNHYKSKLRNAVFEFTPVEIGSDGFGYRNSDPYSVGLAVSVSGAALDSTEVSGKFNSLMASAFNMDLGFYIENYNDESQDNRFARKITPFPLYYAWKKEDPHRRDLLGMDIYLTDGGHTENLGAYSLVRRSCDHIIIVDGEYDEKYEFEGYHHLKEALLSEMQMEMDVPGLMENQNSWKKKTKADGVETGVIKNLITFNNEGNVDYKDLKVTYIKLSINGTLIAQDETRATDFYGKDLVDYYKKSKNNECGQWLKWLFPCEFPQYTTTDQSYSPEQFKAYIDLGYSIVRNSEKIPSLNKNISDVHKD